jgi:hypothetical protein
MKETSMPLEQAKAYVEAQDYLFDENQEIAGNAYMAGYRDALERAAMVADFGAGNMDLYNGPGLSETSKREHEFAARQARALAAAIRKLAKSGDTPT